MYIYTCFAYVCYICCICLLFVYSFRAVLEEWHPSQAGRPGGREVRAVRAGGTRSFPDWDAAPLKPRVLIRQNSVLHKENRYNKPK